MMSIGTHPLTFGIDGGTERMRIDSSGNLLVGKTSANTYNNTNGIELQASGLLTATRTGIAQILNREDSDGDIAVFRKDGSTVGSIGTRSNGLRIDKGNTKLVVYDDGTTNSFFPESSGDDVDLGLSTSGFAWRNLYLSGNITVGGTVDGRDVATDGTKLDGIETGATADQTKADIEGLGIDVPAANLTGTIAAARLSTATTQAESDDSTKIATTAYVTDKITTLIGGAPSTLNDLNELAAAINDDANYNSTLTTALATKLPLAGGTMTGHILLNNGIELRSYDTGGNVKTITRVNSSNELEYGWSSNGPVKFMGGGSYTERMRIHTNGNVGIGTASPSYKLEIAEDTNGTANLLQLRNSDSTYAQTWLFSSDTSKDLIIAGSSSNGGIDLQPGTRGVKVNGSTVWHAGNDGSGSGLDADLLDGYHGNNYIGKNGNSYYQPNTWIDFNSSNAGLYWSGGSYAGWHIYPFDSQDARLRSGNSGAIGVRLETTGTVRGYVYANSSNQVGFLNESRNWRLKVPSSGSIYRDAHVIWDAGNDGAGSGLDADLLDGLQSGSYLRSDADDTMNARLAIKSGLHSTGGNHELSLLESMAIGPTNSNLVYFRYQGSAGNFAIQTYNNANTGELHLQPYGGDVGIGTNGPGHKLDVVGGSIRINDVGHYIYFGTNSSVKIGTVSGNSDDLYLGSADDVNMESNFIRFWRDGYYGSTEYNRLAFSDYSWLCNGSGSHKLGIGITNPSEKLHVVGNILATGNITANSDISLKDNITPIPNALDKVLQIRGVTFNRNDIEDNPRHAGVIAQEVEKVLPEVVSEGEDGIKSVAYGNMVSLLIEAIKEQQEQIDMLKEKLESK